MICELTAKKSFETFLLLFEMFVHLCGTNQQSFFQMFKRSQLWESSPDCVEILLFFSLKNKRLEQKAGTTA